MFIFFILSTEENKKVIGREGAIPPLLQLLRSNVEKIQRNAAVTLKNLTSQNGSSPLFISDLISSHAACFVVFCTFLLALSFLLRPPSAEKNAKRIERENGLDLLSQVLAKNGLGFDGPPSIPKDLLKMHFEDSVKWEDLVLIKKIGEGKYGDVYKVRFLPRWRSS
jgi:hypothetical protein